MQIGIAVRIWCVCDAFVHERAHFMHVLRDLGVEDNKQVGKPALVIGCAKGMYAKHRASS